MSSLSPWSTPKPHEDSHTNRQKVNSTRGYELDQQKTCYFSDATVKVVETHVISYAVQMLPEAEKPPCEPVWPSGKALGW